MKLQKIRGQKRRSKQIKRWTNNNLPLNIPILSKYKKDHIDIIVHPWCDISIINSKIPEPKGKNKAEILSGLLDIYDSLKLELDSMGGDYYLKIWLYEPRFSKSQVVWAVEDKLNFYDNSFFKSDSEKGLKFSNYGPIANRLIGYKWEAYIDEMILEEDHIGNPQDYISQKDYIETAKWFQRTMKKSHRVIDFSDNDEERKFYCFPQGKVWIGSR